MATTSDGSTLSLWRGTERVPGFTPLEKNATADVCIVGAGIAGLTTAYLLTKAGKKVIVLDDGPVAGGETERTTAHLSNEIDDRYTSIAKIHGKDGAKLAAESHTAAIAMIENIVADEKIDCDFERVSGYLFTPPDASTKVLEKELSAALDAGLNDIEMMERIPLLPFDSGPCIHFPNQAQFHPMKYLARLAEAITRDDGHIHTESRVTNIEEEDVPFVIHTAHGKVTAENLVIATNAPINDNAAIYTKQIPYRSFVIAIRIPKDYVPKALLWDTLDPYHYVRLQSDPKRDNADMLIVGGEDHRTGEEDDMQERFERLETWARERFPSATEVLYRWSGQVMETIDGLALIGRKPGGHERSFMITGDSGMGMTHGTIAGMLLTDLITGKENAWADLYDPSRAKLKSGMEFIREHIGTAKSMIGGHISNGSVKDASQIRAGHGGVYSQDGKHIALYRDMQGNAHRFSAVCPHKGCIVVWNDGEQSWDCPCHGSRYTAKGIVLNGPTLKDLEPVESQDDSSNA